MVDANVMLYQVLLAFGLIILCFSVFFCITYYYLFYVGSSENKTDKKKTQDNVSLSIENNRL